MNLVSTLHCRTSKVFHSLRISGRLGGTRTLGVPLKRRMLYQLSYEPFLAGPLGVEPRTAGFGDRCSSRLSYGPIMKPGATDGARTRGLLLGKQVLFRLSYCRKEKPPRPFGPGVSQRARHRLRLNSKRKTPVGGLAAPGIVFRCGSRQHDVVAFRCLIIRRSPEFAKRPLGFSDGDRGRPRPARAQEMAAPPGLEPEPSAPKTLVLPLHHGAIHGRTGPNTL